MTKINVNKEEFNAFKASTDKLKYTIKIDVYENVASTSIENHIEKELGYHEFIGVLYSQLQHIMFSQRENNMKNKELKLTDTP